jgi:hypothetical protein
VLLRSAITISTAIILSGSYNNFALLRDTLEVRSFAIIKVFTRVFLVSIKDMTLLVKAL